MVLFSGMEKTSHWAALYFVALMTFGKQLINPHQNESFYYLSTAFFFTYMSHLWVVERCWIGIFCQWAFLLKVLQKNKV
jgi:hypothetical protein